ncbi:MAG TPA: hypothetical protein VKD91_12295 [Pyrinomonadaceae bacterium]|nr:hypothetical protein [Pyrinomonadaceae bacterium]
MKRTPSTVLVAICGLVFIILPAPRTLAQKDKKEIKGPLVTRTTTRHENVRLQFGGTVELSGPPAGSIIIEGWERNEVDVAASIELQAPTAADLDLLATVNTFVVDEDLNHIRILTSGTHDRAFMKRTAKNFPKTLIGLPWKIDFHIKVPALTDLSIDAGNGPISLSGVEGALRLNALNSDANLSLTGGLVSVLIQGGNVNLRIPSRGWHGLGAEIKMASGKLNIELMPGFSADINAAVLRFGTVAINAADLKPRERDGITPHAIRARAGSGGATLEFTVGDGTIEFKQMAEGGKQ